MSKFFCISRVNRRKHCVDSVRAKDDSCVKGKRNGRKNSRLCLAGSVFLIVTVVAVGGFYVFLMTSSTTDGFMVSEYKTKIKQLKLVNYDLEKAVRELENLNYVKERAAELGLARVESVEYWNGEDAGVAMK